MVRQFVGSSKEIEEKSFKKTSVLRSTGGGAKEGGGAKKEGTKLERPEDAYVMRQREGTEATTQNPFSEC